VALVQVPILGDQTITVEAERVLKIIPVQGDRNACWLEMTGGTAILVFCAYDDLLRLIQPPADATVEKTDSEERES
jgi:hypothetical protein